MVFCVNVQHIYCNKNCAIWNVHLKTALIKSRKINVYQSIKSVDFMIVFVFHRRSKLNWSISMLLSQNWAGCVFTAAAQWQER